MCGIAGYVAEGLGFRPFDDAILKAVAYRGHDARTTWSDDRCVKLFHARLGIIDLAGGGQPMTEASGRFVLVFNGAIYNYKELRREYEAAGAVFRTQSDTEVILHGFALKGEAVVHDLNGMFAFAIWDAATRRLFLARDRLGKKPLFWCKIGQAFVFASSIDAFRSLPGWDDSLSQAGLILYGFLGGFPGEATAYLHAHAVPAACCGWYHIGDAAPALTRYWLPDYARKSRGSEAAFIDEYEELLADAIRIRLRSDVPIALSFSGGTDSGTIAALAKRRFGADLSCYTIDYDTEDEPSEEVRIAREAARILDVPWQHIQYDYRRDILAGLEQTYAFFDQPCQQLALVYSKRLYDVMKRHCTVVLSGNGADEVFTGYVGDEVTANADRTRKWLARVPARIQRMAPAAWQAQWDHARLNGISICDWAASDMMANIARFSENRETVEHCTRLIGGFLDSCREAGIETMLDYVMHRALFIATIDANYRLPDITGYAAQLEVRSPFLDHRMVEFGARLPHRFKVGRFGQELRPKYLPRRLYQRFVGPEIAWARKKGMGANLQWGREFARNPSFISTMEGAYDAVDRNGMDSGPFRAAYRQFQDDFARNAPSRPTAGLTMGGFMLGAWLRQRKAAQGALAACAM